MSCTHDCGCTPEIRDARTDEWVQIAPESARGGCMADFDAPQAPQEVPAPERPANRVSGLPRPIEPADVRVGMVVERRKGDMAHRDRVQQIDGGLIDGTVAYLWKPGHEEGGWSLWLVEDAPEPVDPDAAVIEAIITAYRRSPECSTDAVFGEAMLDHLRAQGFDVTARAEQ